MQCQNISPEILVRIADLMEDLLPNTLHAQILSKQVNLLSIISNEIEINLQVNLQTNLSLLRPYKVFATALPNSPLLFTHHC